MLDQDGKRGLSRAYGERYGRLGTFCNTMPRIEIVLRKGLEVVMVSQQWQEKKRV
jgi:hypothetical protein